MKGQHLVRGAAPKLLRISLGSRTHRRIRPRRYGPASHNQPLAATGVATGWSVDDACSCFHALPDAIRGGKFFSSSTSSETQHEGTEGGTMTNPRSRRRPTFAASIDPTAKRPNAKCDPYGQGGTPMDAANARALLSTVHCDWRIVSSNGASSNIYEGAGIGNESTCLTMQGSKAGDNDKETESGDDGDGAPRYLVREFRHPDLGSGGRFGAVVAAVSEIQAHYPRRIVTERQVVKKSWVVSTTVLCQTQVLGGLSINDFHLAMMIDVEVDRPEVRKLLLPTR